MAIKAKTGQSLWDVAIEGTGTIEQALAIAQLNGIPLDSGLPVGMEVVLPTVEDSDVVNYYNAKGLHPVSGQAFGFEVEINALYEANIINKVNFIDSELQCGWYLNGVKVGSDLVCPVLGVEAGDEFCFEFRYVNKIQRVYFETGSRFGIGEIYCGDASLNVPNITGLSAIRFNEDVLNISSAAGLYDINQSGVIRFVGDVTRLELGNRNVTVKDETIKNLTSLTYLYLHGTNSIITSEGVKGLVNLVRLFLYNTSSVITNEGLQNLINLDILFIYSTDSLVTDVGIQNLTNLTQLYLRDTDSLVTDVGIQNLTNLTQLALNGTASTITNLGVQNLINLRKLVLNATNSVITDIGVQNLTNLTDLYLNGTDSLITDIGVQNLTNLINLDLSSTNSNTITLENNSLISFIKIDHTSNNSASNDLLFQNLDNHGLSNRLLSLVNTGGRTTASDAAKANLLSKGWVITE